MATAAPSHCVEETLAINDHCGWMFWHGLSKLFGRDTMHCFGYECLNISIASKPFCADNVSAATDDLTFLNFFDDQ